MWSTSLCEGWIWCFLCVSLIWILTLYFRVELLLFCLTMRHYYNINLWNILTWRYVNIYNEIVMSCMVVFSMYPPIIFISQSSVLLPGLINMHTHLVCVIYQFFLLIIHVHQNHCHSILSYREWHTCVATLTMKVSLIGWQNIFFQQKPRMQTSHYYFSNRILYIYFFCNGELLVSQICVGKTRCWRGYSGYCWDDPWWCYLC